MSLARPVEPQESIVTTILYSPFRLVASVASSVGGLLSTPLTPAAKVELDINQLINALITHTQKLTLLINQNDKKNNEAICDVCITIANLLDASIKQIQIDIGAAKIKNEIVNLLLSKFLHVPDILLEEAKAQADRRTELSIHKSIVRTNKVANDILSNLIVAECHVLGISYQAPAENAPSMTEMSPLDRVQAELNKFKISLSAMIEKFNQHKTALKVKNQEITPMDTKAMLKQIGADATLTAFFQPDDHNDTLTWGAEQPSASASPAFLHSSTGFNPLPPVTPANTPTESERPLLQPKPF